MLLPRPRPCGTGWAWGTWWRRCLVGLSALFALQLAQAHQMVAQRGTLNIVGNGGFVVMALSVDAFTGVDDDGGGLMSLDEMRKHAGAIAVQVLQGLSLIGADGPRPLEGLMLNLSPDDSTPAAPARHLVVLGRFALAAGDLVDAGAAGAAPGLQLRLTLFGKSADAQQQTITVTRGGQSQKMVLRPGHEAAGLFPTAWSVLRDNAWLGAVHVLGGLDHLLFLLVVLATGWGWKRAALALTVFTAGHAVSLAAVAYGGIDAPARIVEPAIAATIIGMVLFDRWAHARRRPLAPGWRLAQVFGCALVHGLGLAGALGSLGLDATNRLFTMVGFNAGIEAAQLGVALLAGGLLQAAQRLQGPHWLPLATRVASNAAVVTGSVWLAQRAIWA